MVRGTSSHLLVEGVEDQYSIISLMKHHVEWPQEKDLCPVLIEAGGSADQILEPTFLSTKLKSSEVETLGIVIDADESVEGRWDRCRSLLSGTFPNLVAHIPAEGAIVDNADGKRLGIWIMPDNQKRGMLETFLMYLVPDNAAPLLEFGRAAIVEARAKGAPYRDAHRDKALIHTWLGWQDPPGLSLGRALTATVLDANSGRALPFVTWFCNLYRLPTLVRH